MSEKLATSKTNKLIWSMGLPMILSMVLQALYNVVDTMFVINMGVNGTLGNIALSAAFPIQILIVAVGVGTGVGINAALSKSLGENDVEKANKIIGNGLSLIVVFSVVFFLFGAFLSSGYMKLTADDPIVVEMGKQYLKICCCASIGSIGFAVAERFLISTGKTVLSMISQIYGAATNIVLDYVFIYPLQMGVAGAAYATIIGQIVSFVLALVFHNAANKGLESGIKRLKPDGKILKSVYKIGFPAFLMQGALSLSMFGILLIIGTIDDAYSRNLLSGSYGIYYKLMQIALFASFGLSNALISITSFNYETKNVEKIKETAKYGVIDSIIVALLITLVYQIFASPISKLFALTVDETGVIAKSDVIDSCSTALRIATIGYAFMGFSVAAQGVLQGLNEPYSPPIISAARLLIFPIPLAFLFSLSDAVAKTIWLAFPISEILTAAIAFAALKRSFKKKLPLLEKA